MVLWDPTGLSKDKLVLPLNYFFIIQHFDGEHSLAEIGALYLKRFGEFLVPSKIEQLVSDLNEKLFLEGQRAEDARRLAQEAFRRKESIDLLFQFRAVCFIPSPGKGRAA